MTEANVYYLKHYVLTAMHNFLPFQFKLNTYDIIKLGLLTISISLLLGSYARADAQTSQKVEILSIPPQEAFFIEDKTQATSDCSDSNSPHQNTSGNTTPHTSNSLRPKFKDSKALKVRPN